MPGCSDPLVVRYADAPGSRAKKGSGGLGGGGRGFTNSYGNGVMGGSQGYGQNGSYGTGGSGIGMGPYGTPYGAGGMGSGIGIGGSMGGSMMGGAGGFGSTFAGMGVGGHPYGNMLGHSGVSPYGEIGLNKPSEPQPLGVYASDSRRSLTFDIHLTCYRLLWQWTGQWNVRTRRAWSGRTPRRRQFS